jgi:LuxR family maltose regulon positive regulatory protein
VADEVALVRSRLDMPTRLFLAAACLRAGRPDQAAMPLVGLQARARQGAAGSMLFARSVAPLLARQDLRGLLDEADRAELQHWLRKLDNSVALPAAPATPSAARSRTDVPASSLSSREQEVLERIAAGDSNKLIARAFDLSPHTVKRHVANILDKLALNSRGQAAAWYHENAG